MKIALVHDYLGEFGGGERVLEALSEIWPKAPIYTAFYREEAAYERFKNRKIITSWAQKVPFFNTKLHSPLRFLAPLIWNSFDFSQFDVVITSASWYVTKGVISEKQKVTSNKKEAKDRKPKTEGRKPIEVCYCHTPPRYLYGYPTSVEWQKYWPVRVYALLVNHFMRVYDFEAAQRVDWFIANSQNVALRIKKFYRRDSTVIYPPVSLEVPKVSKVSKVAKDGYFLVVSRIVGGKGLQLAVEVANKMGFKLKVVGKPAGYATEYQKITKIAQDNVEFLGFVEDSELVELYSGARAFLALAEDEDFGITPVEAMLAGVPVVAFNGGGYRETVIQGKTGLFFEPATAESLTMAINTFLEMEKKGQWDHDFIRSHAQKYSKERFKREIKAFVESKAP